MLYGTGRTVILTNGLDASSLRGQKALFPQCLASFELAADTNFAEAKCMINGILQTTASAITEENFNLNLTYQFNDWNNLQLLFGELATDESGVTIPQSKVAVVPSGGVINDPEIVGNASSVCVTNTTDCVLLEVVAGPLAGDPEEITVDDGTGDITFDSTLVGKTVEYVVDRTYTSIEAIGVAQTVDLLTNLSFSGVIASTKDGAQGYQIIVPFLERINTPTITLAGDVAEISIEYRALVSGTNRKPFNLYRLSTAVV